MATDERNFRSTYYEKVGCRSVEEKKSLNILLKDNPLNRTKLKQFCLSFTVPTDQRGILWNLILGVLPVYPDSRQYVVEQRVAVYNDVLEAVNTMGYVDDKTTKCKIFYIMWLLENKKLYPEYNLTQDHIFLDITNVLLHVFETDYEIYWIAKEFFEFTREIKNEFGKLKELTKNLLEKEDHILYRHFEDHDIINNLPIEKWYTSCFASIISDQALVKIWDKICGGSRKIVVFVLLALFKTFRMQFMRFETPQQVIMIIEEPKDQDDLIVNKAIESWQNNKSHAEFMVH